MYTWERPRKTEQLAKTAETLKYHLQLKTKEDFGGMGFGHQSGGKAIDMEMEKQTNVCWAMQRHWDREKNFNKQTLLGSSLSTHLVHITFIYGDSSLPGTGPLSTIFRQLGGRSKVLPESFEP